MVIKILPLTAPCSINASLDSVSTNVIIRSSKFKCPAWAERYIVAYLGLKKLGCRKNNIDIKVVFLALVEYAE